MMVRSSEMLKLPTMEPYDPTTAGAGDWGSEWDSSG